MCPARHTLKSTESSCGTNAVTDTHSELVLIASGFSAGITVPHDGCWENTNAA